MNDRKPMTVTILTGLRIAGVRATSTDRSTSDQNWK